MWRIFNIWKMLSQCVRSPMVFLFIPADQDNPLSLSTQRNRSHLNESTFLCSAIHVHVEGFQLFIGWMSATVRYTYQIENCTCSAQHAILQLFFDEYEYTAEEWERKKTVIVLLHGNLIFRLYFPFITPIRWSKNVLSLTTNSTYSRFRSFVLLVMISCQPLLFFNIQCFHMKF